MPTQTIATQPFSDQRCGTAGLRKKVTVFQQPHYLENFLQSIFDCVPELNGGTLIAGGDGRYYNRDALATLLRMAAANGVRRVIVGRGGLLSTPAASLLIAHRDATGGFILTASHNPGGPDGDFGIKFNTAGGGQAGESLTDAFYARSREISQYHQNDATPPALDTIGEYDYAGMAVEVVDPVRDYADTLAELFDFEAIGALLRRPDFGFLFDARHAVTGPYAAEIFLNRLGAPAEVLRNAEPLPDFGGGHPDPNPQDAADLVELFAGKQAPALGGASDGDGDRNMILAPGLFVSPGDSLAVLAANATQVPGYRNGLAGVARSMPTSRAVDAVAAELGVECFETPTGWRFFANLLNAGRITLCGEESFGTSSNHAREKDGLWAVLFWLNLVAATDKSAAELLHEHWSRYGRHYYQRHDWFIPDTEQAQAVMAGLREQLPALQGGKIGGLPLTVADDFEYHDPIDGSVSKHQGIRLVAGEEARIVYRLSGTGTAGATLRLYLERRIAPEDGIDRPVAEVLASLAASAREIADLHALTGLREPTQIT